MAHLYKSRLQTYAQKRNITLPTYTVETQGPPHCRLFKAQVTVAGNTYAGPNFSSTLKDAEHEAAKVAFMSLSQDGAQEDDCLYKSLLQELAQKKGLALPVYATNGTGPPHMRCFVSTVEISGESYVGEDARTKKQSEMNAAKVAYTTLIEGGPRANNATVISNTVGTSSSVFSSLQTVTMQKNEPTTSEMQTINSPANYTIPNDPEKAKGYIELKGFQEVIEKHKMTSPPVMIHQPQLKSSPNVVDLAKLDIKQENHVIQASEVANFSDLAENPEGRLQAEKFLALDAFDRTFKVRITESEKEKERIEEISSSYTMSSVPRSGSKSAGKTITKFQLEDIDSLLSSRSTEKKPSKSIVLGTPKSFNTRSKSLVKRKRGDDVGNTPALFEKHLYDQVAESIAGIKGYYKKVSSLHEKQVEDLRNKLASKDDEIAKLEKDKVALEDQLTFTEIGAEEKVLEAIHQAKISASKAILEARIKVVKEANDANFDRSAWKVDQWEKTLAAFGDEDEAFEVAEDNGKDVGVSGLKDTEMETAGDDAGAKE